MKSKLGAVQKNIYVEARNGAFRFIVQVSPFPKTAATFDACDYDAGLTWAEKECIALREQKRTGIKSDVAVVAAVTPAPSIIAADIKPDQILVREVLKYYRENELSGLSCQDPENTRSGSAGAGMDSAAVCDRDVGQGFVAGPQACGPASACGAASGRPAQLARRPCAATASTVAAGAGIRLRVAKLDGAGALYREWRSAAGYQCHGADHSPDRSWQIQLPVCRLGARRPGCGDDVLASRNGQIKRTQSVCLAQRHADPAAGACPPIASPNCYPWHYQALRKTGRLWEWIPANLTPCATLPASTCIN